MSKITELTRNDISKSPPKPFNMKKEGYNDIFPMTVHGYEIRYKKNTFRPREKILSVWDGNTGAAVLMISPVMYQGVRAYEIGSVALNPAYQGQQLGYELYKGLVVLMGINLISLDSHSPGASKLWARLSRDPKISAYGIDVENRIVFNVRSNKRGSELKSSKKGTSIYSDDPYEDNMIGLIMVKRASNDDVKLSKLLKNNKKKNVPDSSKPDMNQSDVFGITKYDPIDS